MNITIEFFIFKLVEVPIFSLNWQFRFFWPVLPTKGSYFQSKTDEIDTAIEFCIFELVFVSNLTLNNFEFLDQIYSINIFLFKNRKSEHHHWIPHVQISLSTKFQLKRTILIFYIISAQTDNFNLLNQICPKVFPSENRKRGHHHGILHIWISLGTKFQLKTDNFGFFD